MCIVFVCKLNDFVYACVCARLVGRWRKTWRTRAVRKRLNLNRASVDSHWSGAFAMRYVSDAGRHAHTHTHLCINQHTARDSKLRTWDANIFQEAESKKYWIVAQVRAGWPLHQSRERAAAAAATAVAAVADIRPCAGSTPSARACHRLSRSATRVTNDHKLARAFSQDIVCEGGGSRVWALSVCVCVLGSFHMLLSSIFTFSTKRFSDCAANGVHGAL